MVNVRDKRCSHATCTRIPSFSIEGSMTPTFCKQHARDDMVDAKSKRCADSTCTRRPSFNVVDSKTAIYCKRHAKNGMVDVKTRRCCYDLCSTHPSFGIRAARQRGTASSMLRTIWLTSAASVAYMTPARRDLISTSSVAMPRRTASSMLRAAWSTSFAGVAHMALAGGNRRGVYWLTGLVLHVRNIRRKSWAVQ